MPNNTQPSHRGRRLMMKLGMSVITLAMLIVVLEVGTRLLSDTQPPLLQSHPKLGTTFTPHYDGQVFVPESDRFVQLRFNGDGMRGQPFELQKSEGVRRIAILGDSMVAAIGANEEDTAVQVLQQKLSNTPGPEKWEVMNFGVSGSATGQELVLYREVVKHYQPDIVVCAFCIWNDFGDNSRELSSSPNRIYFDLNENGDLKQLKLSQSRSTISTWLNQNSRFYLWQKHATRVATQRTKKRVGFLPKGKLIYHSEPTDELERAWTITEKLIETFHREVESDGSQFVLAVLPSADQIHDENWSRIISNAGSSSPQMDADYPSERLGQLCDRIGVPVIDMVEAFREAAPSRSRAQSNEWQHFGGVGHFNQSGNRLAAEEIFNYLVQQKASTASRQPPIEQR
ncbi:MAG: hypothetical protein CMJ77_06465 [Planctomycetaceae bacterium]|nr:hypothetical protein [Planctomycetaceae bacterium]